MLLGSADINKTMLRGGKTLDPSAEGLIGVVQAGLVQAGAVVPRDPLRERVPRGAEAPLSAPVPAWLCTVLCATRWLEQVAMHMTAARRSLQVRRTIGQLHCSTAV